MLTNDWHIKVKRTFRYFRLNFLRKISSFKRGGILSSFLYLFLFAFLFFIFEYFFYSTSVFQVNQEEFSRILHEKETYAEQTLERIRDVLGNEDITALYQMKDLYEESERREVSFHIYQGDQLEFWTNNVVALHGVSNFSFASEFFYVTDNAHVVVLQSFFREYRCVALIKIKDNIFPRNLNLWKKE